MPGAVRGTALSPLQVTPPKWGHLLAVGSSVLERRPRRTISRVWVPRWQTWWLILRSPPVGVSLGRVEAPVGPRKRNEVVFVKRPEQRLVVGRVGYANQVEPPKG